MKDPHRITDGWEDAIRTWLTDSEMGCDHPRGLGPVRLDAVLRGALGFDSRRYGRREELRAGRALRALGFERRETREGKQTRKVWLAVNPQKFTDLCFLSGRETGSGKETGKQQ